MTDKQKEAIEILNNLRMKQSAAGDNVMTSEDYFKLLEFIIDNKREIEIHNVPQPAFPWTWPQPLEPYYTTTDPDQFKAPYRITCEFIKE